MLNWAVVTCIPVMGYRSNHSNIIIFFPIRSIGSISDSAKSAVIITDGLTDIKHH